MIVEEKRKMNEDEVNEAKAFIDAFIWSRECGLDVEFVQFFLDEFKRSGNVYEAIWYANCEWDL